MDFLKIFHILFLVLWVGSLLTETRLLALMTKEPPEVQKKLALFCKRLYLSFDLPSMVMALSLGIAVIIVKGVDLKAGWLHMKWTFAFFLILFDLEIGRQIFKMAKMPTSAKGVKFMFYQGLIALFLMGALVSIYIVKARVT